MFVCLSDDRWLKEGETKGRGVMKRDLGKEDALGKSFFFNYKSIECKNQVRRITKHLMFQCFKMEYRW